MLIIHQSPELLVVSERPLGLRMCGAVLGVTGASLVVMALRTSSLSAGIAGGCILFVGAMFALLPRTSTFSFNRLEQRFVVSHRHLLSGTAGREHFRLRDITAVRPEKSAVPGDAETAWRIVVRLADGRTIPFESYYTSGYAVKAAMAERIANFLTNEAGVGPVIDSRVPLFR